MKTRHRASRQNFWFAAIDCLILYVLRGVDTPLPPTRTAPSEPSLAREMRQWVPILTLVQLLLLEGTLLAFVQFNPGLWMFLFFVKKLPMPNRLEHRGCYTTWLMTALVLAVLKTFGLALAIRFVSVKGINWVLTMIAARHVHQRGWNFWR